MDTPHGLDGFLKIIHFCLLDYQVFPFFPLYTAYTVLLNYRLQSLLLCSIANTDKLYIVLVFLSLLKAT